MEAENAYRMATVDVKQRKEDADRAKVIFYIVVIISYNCYECFKLYMTHKHFLAMIDY